MNIFFLTQIVPYPPHGGVLQRGYNILRELSLRNRVHLAAFVHSDVLRTEEQIEESKEAISKYCESIQYISLWPKRSKLHNLTALLSGLVINKPFSVIAHASNLLHRHIQYILENRRIDILHYDTIALAQYHKKQTMIPSVVTHHNIESQLLERRAAFEKFFPIRKYLEVQACKLRNYETTMSTRFDVNIMVSPLDEAELKIMAPGVKTCVVPNGVDPMYFQPGDPRHEAAVIYTGGMNMFANRDAVLYFIRSIWPKVKQAVRGVRFDVVGQDPPKELLEIAQTDESIKVHGYVEDIRPYVEKAAVYVVPIRVGGGTRLKVLDALAMGKAIVSTTLGCEGIGVSNGLNIVVEDDPKIFSEQVANLLKNENRRNALGEAGRTLAEAKYSWKTIGTGLIEAYEMAIKCHRAQTGTST